MSLPISDFPSLFEIGASLWVAQVLPPEGSARSDAHASYRLIPTGGIYRQEDFQRAEKFLIARGLLIVIEDFVVPHADLIEIAHLPRSQAMELLLLACVERLPPLWTLGASDGSTLALELIPDADWASFESLVPDAARREEFLLALRRRFDASEAATLGAAGELFVVEQCKAELVRLGKPELALRVRRVSTVSDQLGYDVVTPTLDGNAWRLEVKTTRSTADNVRIFLSRNEARTGLADRRWALVVCLQDERGGLQIVGWCHAPAFEAILPTDPAKNGFWVSASLSLNRSQLSDGLPALGMGACA